MISEIINLTSIRSLSRETSMLHRSSLVQIQRTNNYQITKDVKDRHVIPNN